MVKKLAYVLVAMLAVNLYSFDAQSKMNIKQKKQFKSWQNYFDKGDSWVPRMNKNCGTSIKFQVSQTMVAPYMAENRSGTYFCDDVASQLNNWCKNDKDNIYKPEIKKIKKVVCTTNAKKPEGKEYKLEKGTLTVTVGAKASNTSRAFKDWFENNM